MQANTPLPLSANALRALVMISISTGFAFTPSYAQSSMSFITRFQPWSVTYNGSDNPNECWESVDWGILIKAEKRSFFVGLPYESIAELEKRIGDREVAVDVILYNEPPTGSGMAGVVTKITLNGEVIFTNL